LWRLLRATTYARAYSYVTAYSYARDSYARDSYAIAATYANL
jgi:hypothetical protein